MNGGGGGANSPSLPKMGPADERDADWICRSPAAKTRSPVVARGVGGQPNSIRSDRKSARARVAAALHVFDDRRPEIHGYSFEIESRIII